jgi:hypothetical protein
MGAQAPTRIHQAKTNPLTVGHCVGGWPGTAPPVSRLLAGSGRVGILTRMRRDAGARRWLAVVAGCLLALAIGAQTVAASALPVSGGCAGGRFITSVDTVQQQNWIEKSPTIYDQQQTALRLPRWLFQLKIVHASQGFLLSGEERLGQWTTVTVPPSLTLTATVFGKHLYWPLILPVLHETKACRDANGNLYVR